MPIRRQESPKDPSYRHPIKKAKQFKERTTEAVNQRKQQLINDERMPEYNQAGQLKMLLGMLGVLAAMLLVLLLMSRL